MRTYYQITKIWIVMRQIGGGSENIEKVFDSYENAFRWVTDQTKDKYEAWKYRIFEFPVEGVR